MRRLIGLMTVIAVMLFNLSIVKAESEIDFEDLFENHQSVMLIIHPQTGEIFYANQAAVDFYGYPKHQLMGMNIDDINMLTPEEVAAERQRAADEERNFFNFKHQLADGDIRTVHVYSYPVEINGDTYLFSIVIDQTVLAATEARNRLLIMGVISLITLGVITTTSLMIVLWRKNLRLKETDERFKVLHNASLGGIVIHDQGVIIDCNQGLSDITGYSHEELIGMDGLLLFTPDQRDFVMHQIQSGHEMSYESLGLRKNGEIYPIRLEARNIPYKGKRVRVAEFRDITQSKSMENRLIKSERRLDRAMAVKNEGIWDWDLEADLVEFDDRYYVMAGYSPQEFPSTFEAFQKRVHPEDFNRVENTIKNYITGKHSDFQVEFRFMRKDESWMWIEGKGKIFEYTEDGQPKRFIGTHTDITQRKHIEAELKKSEEKFRIAQEMSPDGFTILKPVRNETGEIIDFTFVYENEAVARINRTDPEEVMGKSLLELLPDHRGTAIFEKYMEVANTGRSQVIEQVNVEQIISDSIWLRLVIVSMGEDIAILAHDITEKRKAEERLEKSEMKYRTLIKQSADGLFLHDLEGNIVEVNDAAIKLTGYGEEELLTLNVFDIHRKGSQFTMDKSQVLKLWKDLKIGDMYKDEAEHQRKDGSVYPVELSLNKISLEGQAYIFAVISDITERKSREREIVHISNHDYLTDIPNRRYFQEMLMKYDKERFYPLGIIYLDMNGLKLINDAYGHQFGNEALRLTADKLNSVKEKNQFLARIGGDEFAMICPNTNAAKLDRMIRKIEKTKDQISVKDINVSLAVGYDIKHREDESIRTTITRAENNMYRNKVVEGMSGRNDVIKSILQTLQNKFAEEKVHSERVSEYCRTIGEAMNLKKEDLNELQMAGLYHDIGKITIPDRILDKPGKLTEDEWEIMRKHTVSGYQILRAADRYSNIAEYAMSHHERIDGKGYPNGITGDKIPLFSRIIAVADAYEAMTADRPYRKALKKQEAVEELKRHAGTQFDADIVDVFLTQVGQL